MSPIVTKDGRVFVLVGKEPYQRKDGTMTELLVWQTSCAVCDAPFKVTTPFTVTCLGDTKAFGLKHCAKHRLTKDQVQARWLHAIMENRKRKNDAQ